MIPTAVAASVLLLGAAGPISALVPQAFPAAAAPASSHEYVTTISGTIASFDYGKHGEVKGFYLDNGYEVKLPKHVHATPELISIGWEVEVTGLWHQGRHGNGHLRAGQIRYTETDAVVNLDVMAMMPAPGGAGLAPPPTGQLAPLPVGQVAPPTGEIVPPADGQAAPPVTDQMVSPPGGQVAPPPAGQMAPPPAGLGQPGIVAPPLAGAPPPPGGHVPPPPPTGHVAPPPPGGHAAPPPPAGHAGPPPPPGPGGPPPPGRP